MQDARIATGLPSHPKTRKLIRALGQAAAWNLVCLIAWTRANRSDGDLSGMSVEDIEIAADWLGDEGRFVAELARVRFLDEVDGGYVMHDWTDHQPWAAGAELRALKAKWNAVKRHHGEAEANRQFPEYAAMRLASSKCDDASSSASSNATSKKKDASSIARGADVAMLGDESSIAPSPSPSPSPSPEEHESTDVDLSAAGGDAAADDDAGSDEDQKPNGPPVCPHSAIIDLWHEVLPEMPAVRTWEGDRIKHLRARWRADPQRQSLEWWRGLFEYVGESDFLTGQKTDFVASLPWLVCPENFAKVLDGAYENNRRRRA